MARHQERPRLFAGLGILVSFFTALTKKTLALQAERMRRRGLG